MKKILSLLFVMLICASSVLAATSKIVAGPKKAYAKFDVKELVFDVTLFNLAENYKPFGSYDVNTDTTTKVDFDIDNVVPGTTDIAFSSGTVFAKIHSELTAQQPNNYVYIFTKNKQTENPAFNVKVGRTENWGTVEAPVMVTAYNGLVRANGQATKEGSTTYNPGDFAPIKIVCITTATADAGQYSLNKFPSFSESKTLLDIDDVTANPEQQESVITQKQTIGKTEVNGGILIGDDTYSGIEDVIMFFGAEFSSVMWGDEYQTDTIVFEYRIDD